MARPILLSGPVAAPSKNPVRQIFSQPVRSPVAPPIFNAPSTFAPNKPARAILSPPVVVNTPVPSLSLSDTVSAADAEAAFTQTDDASLGNTVSPPDAVYNAFESTSFGAGQEDVTNFYSAQVDGQTVYASFTDTEKGEAVGVYDAQGNVVSTGTCAAYGEPVSWDGSEPGPGPVTPPEPSPQPTLGSIQVLEPGLPKGLPRGVAYGTPPGALFDGPPSSSMYDDPDQGPLGDCYLVSAMSEVASTEPQTIRNMFTENADGTLTVKLYAHSPLGASAGPLLPINVTIDRQLPLLNGTPYFTHSPNPNELWPSYLEKAVAALTEYKYSQPGWPGGSGYDLLPGMGISGEALSMMTGRDFQIVYSFLPSGSSVDPAQVAAKLSALLQTGHEVGAGTQSLPGGASRPYGLVDQHAYSVLGISQQNGQTMVQLRNPWGYEPTTPSTDGTFSIPIADFVQQFQLVWAD